MKGFYSTCYRCVLPGLLQAESDTCWIKVAGEDPIFYVRKYQCQVPIVHLKESINEGILRNLYKLIGIDSEKEQEDSVFSGSGWALGSRSSGQSWKLLWNLGPNKGKL